MNSYQYPNGKFLWFKTQIHIDWTNVWFGLAEQHALGSKGNRYDISLCLVPFKYTTGLLF